MERARKIIEGTLGRDAGSRAESALSVLYFAPRSWSSRFRQFASTFKRKKRLSFVSVNWLPGIFNSWVISGSQYPYYLCVTLQMLFADSEVNKVCCCSGVDLCVC